jgi:hypothetical protein
MKFTRPLRLLLCPLIFMLLAITLPSQASIINLTADIDAAQANAGNGTVGSMGTGVGTMMFDDVTNIFSWDVSWSNLAGTVTVAHFHGPAMPNQNAGVQLAMAIVFDTSTGSAIISAPQAADLLTGLWYINIHSDFAPGGEIRGRVLTAPVIGVSVPGTLALVLLSMIGLFNSRKKA